MASGSFKNSLIEYKFWFAYCRKFSGILNTLYYNLEELSEAIKKLGTPRKELYRHTLALVYGEL
jgi:hypothetical protein